MSKNELKIKAKDKGIKRYYEMTKPQLILALADSKNIPDILEKIKKKASCEHGGLKIYCPTCCGKKFCIHKKRKDFCKECGVNFCVHGRLCYFCKECDGKYICVHKRIKHQCKDCITAKAAAKLIGAKVAEKLITLKSKNQPPLQI